MCVYFSLNLLNFAPDILNTAGAGCQPRRQTILRAPDKQIIP